MCEDLEKNTFDVEKCEPMSEFFYDPVTKEKNNVTRFNVENIYKLNIKASNIDNLLVIGNGVLTNDLLVATYMPSFDVPSKLVLTMIHIPLINIVIFNSVINKFTSFTKSNNFYDFVLDISMISYLRISYDHEFSVRLNDKSSISAYYYKNIPNINKYSCYSIKSILIAQNANDLSYHLQYYSIGYCTQSQICTILKQNRYDTSEPHIPMFLCFYAKDTLLDFYCSIDNDNEFHLTCKKTKLYDYTIHYVPLYDLFVDKVEKTNIPKIIKEQQKLECDFKYNKLEIRLFFSEKNDRGLKEEINNMFIIFGKNIIQ